MRVAPHPSRPRSQIMPMTTARLRISQSKPAALATPTSHSQPSGVASEWRPYLRSSCSSIAPPSTWWTRATSLSPGSSGARGKRRAGEARPGPGRRGRIAHLRRWQCAAAAPAAVC
eukprot:scaffold10515_cov68-Phaeocystis_antarctica.AAC.1